jgi:protoheme IX farnesyltransferase
MTGGIKHYFLVAKPGIVLGNLVAAAGGFLLASRGRIHPALLMAALSGISLVVASACVFNNCIDRNLDRKMPRTRNRVLARGLMSARSAVRYALFLGLAGAALLQAAAGLPCLVVVLSGFAVYVLAYSLYLKPRSPHAPLIGSLAGVAPPLAGYFAAGGRFDAGALMVGVLFALWQMPHAHAIALYHHEEYAGAGIPVLPVRRGVPMVKRHIVVHILIFAAAALMLTFGGHAGYRYLAAGAAMMGLSWLVIAVAGMRKTETRRWARQLFVFSLLTVVVLCLLMALGTSGELERYAAAPGCFHHEPGHG